MAFATTGTTPFGIGTMSAAQVNGVFDDIEKYINGGIDDVSVRWSGSGQRWVQPRHIFKPEFYGSPDPRIEATSGTVHYRFTPLGRLDWSVHHGLTCMGTDSGYGRGTSDMDVPPTLYTDLGELIGGTWDPSLGGASAGSTEAKKYHHATGRWQRQPLWPNPGDCHPGQWQTIRGMGVTVVNEGGPGKWEDDAILTRDCIVTASCSAREGGTFNHRADGIYQKDKEPYSESGTHDAAFGPEHVECARLALFLDGKLVGNTVRRIFTSRGQRWVNKNFMWVETFALSGGIHSIEVRIKVLERFQAAVDPPDKWKHIFVDSRSMVVDLQSFRENAFYGLPEADTSAKEPALIWP